jgi:hypothetical protein
VASLFHYGKERNCNARGGRIDCKYNRTIEEQDGICLRFASVPRTTGRERRYSDAKLFMGPTSKRSLRWELDGDTHQPVASIGCLLFWPDLRLPQPSVSAPEMLEKLGHSLESNVVAWVRGGDFGFYRVSVILQAVGLCGFAAIIAHQCLISTVLCHGQPRQIVAGVIEIPRF